MWSYTIFSTGSLSVQLYKRAYRLPMQKTTQTFLNIEIIQVANIHHKLFNFTIAFSVHSLYISIKYSGPAFKMAFKML